MKRQMVERLRQSEEWLLPAIRYRPTISLVVLKESLLFSGYQRLFPLG